MCNWRPSEIACTGGRNGDSCLTPAEIEVVEKLYSGATNAKGAPWYYGMSRGSEYGWTPGYIGANGHKGDRIDGPQSGMEEFVRTMPFFYDKPLNSPAAEFDFDRDPPRRAMMEILYNVQNPDLRRYKKLGGKLILYHGWDDNSIPPGASVDYYETATATMGGPGPTKEFFRLFMVPGMLHCARGNGGGELDFLTALENWIEKAQAPEQVTAYRLVNDHGGPRPIYPLSPSQYDQSRPVFAYPDTARYTGKGDPKQAANWQKAARRN
jgi:feruloyl esterase